MSNGFEKAVSAVFDELESKGKLHDIDIRDDVITTQRILRSFVEDKRFSDIKTFTQCIDSRRTILLKPENLYKLETEGFFKRYLTYLNSSRDEGGKGWSNDQVKSLENEVLTIFDNFKNLEIKALETNDVRGLVIGRVQSGKTSNFMGLVNLALDNDFKAIIILTSNNENLRIQTQIRLEEGVWGYRSGLSVAQNPIEVGKFSQSGLNYEINLNTSREPNKGEFNSSETIKSNWQKPQIFVCKKNKYILNNLIQALYSGGNEEEEGQLPYKLLLIDDEGDYSSIYKDRIELERNRAINERIRVLLCIFKTRAFAAYTASPYANILSYMDPTPGRAIDIEFGNVSYNYSIGPDLFPKDYINLLPKNQHYYGVEEIFGNDYDDMILVNLDHEEFKTVDNWSTYFGNDWVDRSGIIKEGNPLLDGLIPNSLKISIYLFYISSAIYKIRFSEEITVHTTMLVNNSYLTIPQQQIVENIQKFHQESVINRLDELKDEFMIEMRGIYYRFYSRTKFEDITYWRQLIGYYDRFLDQKTNYEDWEEIKLSLIDVIREVSIISVNTQSEDELVYSEYESGYQIVVGGNKLSRGLTLEGLLISYFTRSSNYMDSFLQMGRWFGYRRKYIDLCRIFIPNEQINQFSLIADSHKYLRAQIEEIVKKNIKPENFRFELLFNPMYQELTSGSFKNRLVKLINDLQNTNQEPINFEISISELVNDYEIFKTQISKLPWTPTNSPKTGKVRAFKSEGVSTDWVIETVKSLYHNGFSDEKFENILKFIQTKPSDVIDNDLLVSSEIEEWGVFIITLQETESGSSYDLMDNMSIFPVYRRNAVDSGNVFGIIGGRLMDPQDEILDMSSPIRGHNARKERDHKIGIINFYLIDLKDSNGVGTNTQNTDLEKLLAQLEDYEKIPLIAFSFIFSQRDVRNNSRTFYTQPKD